MEPPVGGRRRQEEEGMSLSRMLGGRGGRVTDLGAKELPVFLTKNDESDTKTVLLL